MGYLIPVFGQGFVVSGFGCKVVVIYDNYKILVLGVT